LWLAARYNKLTIVELLLQHAASDDLQATTSAQSALWVAASYGHAAIVRALTNSGAKCVWFPAEDDSPLHVAIQRRRFAVALLLLEHLQDSAMIDYVTKFGVSPIENMFRSLSTMYKQTDQQERQDLIVALLNHGAVPCHVNNTAWFRAVAILDSTIITHLVQAGCDAKQTCRHDNQNVLHYILDHYQTQPLSKITRLVDDHGLDVNAQDFQGNTSMHYAACKPHLKAVEFLFQRGASIQVTNNQKFTPLHMACQVDRGRAVAKFLIQHQHQLIQSPPKTQSVLHEAALHHRVDIVELLIRSKADVNHVNRNRARPLELAMRSASDQNRLLIVQLLLQHQADPNGYTGKAKSALMAAVCKYDQPTVALLLQNKADVHSGFQSFSTLYRHMTPLHWMYSKAKKSCSLDLKWNIIGLLIQHGASVETVDGPGCSLLDQEQQNSQPPFRLRDLVRKYRNGQRQALCSGSHGRLGNTSAIKTFYRSKLFEPQLLPLLFQFAGVQRDSGELQEVARSKAALKRDRPQSEDEPAAKRLRLLPVD
jgi:ankyrin repeat protein